MLAKLRLLRWVEEDLAGQRDYYETERPGLGDDFMQHVAAAIEQARRFPRSGVRVTDRRYATEVRRFQISRFPFHVFAAIHDDQVVIVALAHHKRRPGYWAGRLDDV